MKYVYAAANEAEFIRYRTFASDHDNTIRKFISFLNSAYQVSNLPRAIVLASSETATGLLSDIPIPAYTNEHRTMFCPELNSWQSIYLKQTDNPEIRRYYETALSENHVLQILGHEFVHHSNLFIDEAYERARWFEEGMCEYISRRYFLTDEEFESEARINYLLVMQFEKMHGVQSLEEFCAETYSQNYADIFYFYWKSFLAVNRIVERLDYDVTAVFREYRQWFKIESSMPLTEWFQI